MSSMLRSMFETPPGRSSNDWASLMLDEHPAPVQVAIADVEQPDDRQQIVAPFSGEHPDPVADGHAEIPGKLDADHGVGARDFEHTNAARGIGYSDIIGTSRAPAAARTRTATRSPGSRLRRRQDHDVAGGEASRSPRRRRRRAGPSAPSTRTRRARRASRAPTGRLGRRTAIGIADRVGCDVERRHRGGPTIISTDTVISGLQERRRPRHARGAPRRCRAARRSTARRRSARAANGCRRERVGHCARGAVPVRARVAGSSRRRSR